MSKTVNFEEGIYKYLDIPSLGLGVEDYYYKDKNETSLYFKGKEGVKPVDFLRDVFKIEDALFDEKFLESISGDGNEGDKNYALKSSSLCALLFFYKVSKENPIHYKGIEYTKAYFEVKNKVTSKPSNMDVVLIGTKEERDDSILFIESKFSEFIGTGEYSLAKTYRREPYRHMFFNDVFNYDEQKVFQYGLKQLITHYIGIRNFLTSEMDEYKKEMAKSYNGKIGNRVEVYKGYRNVGFLEIVFKMAEDDYKEYVSETKKVFDSLEREVAKDKMPLELYGTVTYQDFFPTAYKKNLDQRVKDYYRIDSCSE